MYVVQRVGFGEYTKGTDFSCAQTRGNYVCVAKTTATKDVYKELQRTIRTVASAMAAAGRLPVPTDIETIVVDGQLGYITATGVAFIGAAFSPAVAPPESVAWAFEPGITAQARVERIASRAQEITDYFSHVAANYPEAIAPEPEVVERIVERVVYQEPKKKRLTAVGAIAMGSLFLGLLGYAATSVYKHTKGDF